MVEKKVIRDPIHGYIKIEKDILNEIVDDKHFQRLRRIEQTSMRCLYLFGYRHFLILSIEIHKRKWYIIKVKYTLP